MSSSAADSKDSSASSTSANHDWSSLPAVLLAQTLSWLGDVQSIVSLQAACKAWHSIPQEKLEPLWKQQYLRDFEAESLNHECVTVSGEATAFRKRYEARATIEQRWSNKQFRSFEAKLKPGPNFFLAELCSPLARLVIALDYWLILFDLEERKESTRWQAAPSHSEITKLRLDSSLPHAAIAYDGQLAVWDVGGPAGKRLASIRSLGSTADVALEGDHLFQISFGRAYIWNWRNEELLRKFDLTRYSSRVHPISATSVFSESSDAVRQLDVDANGKAECKAELPLPPIVRCRRDSRSASGLLVCTPSRLVCWDPAQRAAPDQLKSPTNGGRAAYVRIGVRWPRHVVTEDQQTYLVDSKRGRRVLLGDFDNVACLDWRFLVCMTGTDVLTITVRDFARQEKNDAAIAGAASSTHAAAGSASVDSA